MLSVSIMTVFGMIMTGVVLVIVVAMIMVTVIIHAGLCFDLFVVFSFFR